VLRGAVPAQQRSSVRGERGGLRALVWLSWLPMRTMLSALLSCARGEMVFLGLAEEGDFPHTGPWHCDGWVDHYSCYYYFGRLICMDPFDERFFNSSGFFSANMVDKGHVVYNDQAGGHCCWLDASDWWIFCCTFLLLEVLIEQSMAGFLGWVTGVVADLLDWVVGVRSSTGDGAGSCPQVMSLLQCL
jgi:hypothetical protein